MSEIKRTKLTGTPEERIIILQEVRISSIPSTALPLGNDYIMIAEGYEELVDVYSKGISKHSKIVVLASVKGPDGINYGMIRIPTCRYGFPICKGQKFLFDVVCHENIFENGEKRFVRVTSNFRKVA